MEFEDVDQLGIDIRRASNLIVDRHGVFDVDICEQHTGRWQLVEVWVKESARRSGRQPVRLGIVAVTTGRNQVLSEDRELRKYRLRQVVVECARLSASAHWAFAATRSA